MQCTKCIHDQCLLCITELCISEHLQRSDAQTQIDKVSALATKLSTVVSNVSTTANSALSLANSLNLTL